MSDEDSVKLPNSRREIVSGYKFRLYFEIGAYFLLLVPFLLFFRYKLLFLGPYVVVSFLILLAVMILDFRKYKRDLRSR